MCLVILDYCFNQLDGISQCTLTFMSKVSVYYEIESLAKNAVRWYLYKDCIR